MPDVEPGVRGRPVVVLVLALALVGCGADDDATRSASSVSGPPRVPATQEPPPRSASSAPSSTNPPFRYPEAINGSMIVEDGEYATVEEMAHAADLVIVGDVVGVESLGRPAIDEDPYADEYVAVVVDVAEVLKGAPVGQVVLGWDAIQVNPAGDRVATLLLNGIRPPQVADRMLLFLDPAEPSFVDALDDRPTHSPVLLDGVAYLDGDRLVAGETVSTTAHQLLAMSLTQVRQLVEEAAANPRSVGEPIQPGGG